MNILITDLHKHTAALSQQFPRHDQPVAQISQVRMDAQLPGIPEGLDLLRLARGVLRLAILYVPLACAHLPVRAELDPVGRIHVDHLHPPLQPLFLRQRGHHQQAVAQDHAVGPVLLVVVEIHQLLEMRCR